MTNTNTTNTIKYMIIFDNKMITGNTQTELWENFKKVNGFQVDIAQWYKATPNIAKKYKDRIQFIGRDIVER